MEKTVEVLKTITEAARAFWEGGATCTGSLEDYFETEMVRAEDYLKELEEMSWDHEIFVIATAPEANKVYDGRLFYTEEHALSACDDINRHCETPEHWKVYRGIINFNKGALVMPIYEFECGACGHTKEILKVKKADLPIGLLHCDKCKEGVYKKVMSVPSDPVIHGFSEKNSYSHTKDVKKDNKEKT